VKNTEEILLINSIPKSGTYLVAKFLDEIGVKNSGIHLRNNIIWNFKNKSLEEIISNPDQFRENAALDASLVKIRSREYFLAHLDYNENIESILLKFNIKHIFLYRKIRDVLVSHFRFVCDRRRVKSPTWFDSSLNQKKMFLVYLRSAGIKYLKGIEMQSEWVNKSNVQKLKFEDLIGDNGMDKKIYSLRVLVESAGFNFSQKDFFEIFNKKCLAVQTRTYSGARSDPTLFWSDQAETIFVENGGLDIEQAFASTGK
jgi:hypothetical protein